MERHIEIYDNSHLQITFCYEFKSLNSRRIKEIVTKLKDWIQPNRFVYYAQEYGFENDDWTQFDKLNEDKDFLYGYLFHSINDEMIAFGHSFHYATPPDYFYLRLEKNKLDSLLNSNFFNEYISQSGFVSCLITNEKYRRYENEINISFYKSAGFDVNDVKLIDEYGDGNLSIDRSNSPAREYAIKNAIIGAYWQMWFAPPFYPYVSKERLLAFPDAFEIKELPNDMVYIRLYEHFNEPHFKKSQDAQHAFLKWIDYEGLVARDKAQAFPNGIIPDNAFKQSKSTFWEKLKSYLWLWGVVWYHRLFIKNKDFTTEHRKDAIRLVNELNKKKKRLDFSVESLQILDEIMEKEVISLGEAHPNTSFEQNFTGQLYKFGAYIGEVIIRNFPSARWQTEKERVESIKTIKDADFSMFGVLLPDESLIYPIEFLIEKIEHNTKIYEQINNIMK